MKRILMNRFISVFILFTLSFFTHVHTAQISKTITECTVTKEPLTLESEDYQYVIIIHPEQVNIYESRKIYTPLSPDDRMRCIEDHAFRIQALITHDTKHPDTKLTETEHDELSKKFSDEILNTVTCTKSNQQCFIRIFESIVRNCQADINHVYNTFYCPRTHLERAFHHENTDFVSLLLLMGADVTINSSSHLPRSIPDKIKAVIKEIYNAREVEQGKMFDKLIDKKGGHGKALATMIISYLLGNNHKVCAIKKAQQT
jgi:hypothetical protein